MSPGGHLVTIALARAAADAGTGSVGLREGLPHRERVQLAVPCDEDPPLGNDRSLVTPDE
jgi:hypothetical protein